MPVYNTEKYLERCLNSIVNQTYKNWELIAVNDGSTDNSNVILEKYAHNDNRVIVVNNNKQGVGKARNKALNLAKGEFICFVDSDDWLELNYLEELYKAATKSNSDVAICSFYYSTEKGEKIGYSYKSDVIPLREYKSKLIKDDISSYLWIYIYKKDLLRNIRFNDLIACQDNVFLTEMLFKLNKDVAVVNKPIYHYYQRDNSTMHTKIFKRELCFFEAYKARYNLDYINNEEKAFCLKQMLISYFLFYQTGDYDKNIIKNCLKVINSTNKIIFEKAKKLLNKKQFLRFILAYYCPVFYKPLYKIYLAIFKLLPKKDLLDFCNTKVI